MKTIPILFRILVASCFVFTAHTYGAVLETVDKEVWQIFKTSLEEGDAEAFNAIHTEDVIRSYGDTMITGQDFRNRNIKVFSNPKLPEATIDFSFVSRAHTDEVVYEVGYYRMKMIRDGEETKNYGMFHVVLKKIDGTWKVAQDWDTSELHGEKISAKHFASGTLLNLTQRST